MNRTLIAAAIAFVAASSAFAESPTIDNTRFVSGKSRAEVAAELQQFRASGVNPWAQNYDQLRGFSSTKSRAQVTAEYVQSRDAIAAMTGEDSGSAYLSARARALPAPVLAGQPFNAQ